MNDTDKLIAAIFAATMTARDNGAEPRDFFDRYDACIAEFTRREAADSADKAERKRDAQDKAWG